MNRTASLTNGRAACVAACCAVACVDSFLIDPFLLLGLGVVYTWLLNMDKRTDRGPIKPALGVFSVLVFWIVSISLYLDLGWIEWMWKMCGARSGRDWMINSGVFDFPYGVQPAWVHGLAVLYPLWMALGFRLGRAIAPDKR